MGVVEFINEREELWGIVCGKGAKVKQGVLCSSHYGGWRVNLVQAIGALIRFVEDKAFCEER